MVSRNRQVDTTSLWKEAQRQFKAAHPKDHREYLKRQVTPETATEELRENKERAVQKSHQCGTIFERLELFLDIGDIVVKAAPETVGLAWAGFSLVFKIIVHNIQVTNELVEATDSISHLVLVCEIYGKRYLNGSWKDLPMKEKVLKLIPTILSTVLEFSYLVQKWTGGHFRRLRNFLSGRAIELQSTIQNAKTQCETLRSIDEDGFKEEARRTSERLKDFMNRASESIETQTMQFSRLEKQITKWIEQWDESEVNEDFKRNIRWFQSGKIAKLDLPRHLHGDNISRRQQGSCDWIFDSNVKEYQSWMNGGREKPAAKYGGMLWLHGGGGVGKSTLVSTIISDLQNNRKHTVVYFFCKLGDKLSQNGDRIMLHLCAQLFQKGRERNIDKQREFNGILDEERNGLPPSDKEGASNIPIDTSRSILQKLAVCLGKNVTIAVDGLDECIERDSKLFSELKELAGSNSKIRVLVSSRNPPKAIEVQRILVDKSRTEAGIRKYVNARKKSAGLSSDAITKIVRKSDGSFRFAIMVTEELQSPASCLRNLDSRMEDLPSTTNDLYLKTFRLLNTKSQGDLATVLRWLICRGDRIELQPIADEFAQKYPLNEYGNKRDPKFPSLQQVSETLSQIGRDFIKVSKNTVRLDHNSVRDFVDAWCKRHHVASNKCSMCGKADQVDFLSEVTGKEGKLIMAEHMLRTINSVKFQKEFILLQEDDNPSGTTESRNASALKGNRMRYEAYQWYKHLREAEAVWSPNERQSEPRWSALYKLAEQFLSQDSRVYQDWLVRKNDIQNKVKRHDPPLYTAARYGLEGLIQRYLDHGHDVNITNRHKSTPLHRVCSNKDSYCGSAGLAILLERHAGVNEENAEGETPLLAAFKNSGAKGFDRPIKDLIEHGANPGITDKRLRSCLHYAAQSHNIKACEVLLPESDPEMCVERANLEDDHGETPLHWACKSNAPESMIQLFLDRRANPTARDKEEQTPLYEACRVGNVDVARLLLENGANIHDHDFKGDTALHEAVYSGNLDLVKFLIKREDGAKVDTRNHLAQTPLGLAASKGKWEILYFLIEWLDEQKHSMRILSKPDSRGDTPLSLAVAAKNLVAVEKLLDDKYVKNSVARDMCEAVDSDKNQPLHKAASRGCPEICRLLIRRGARTEAAGKSSEYGSTALDAAFKGWQEWNGDDVSRLREFEETAELLLAQGSVVHKAWRKLICAIWRGSVSVCEKLKVLVKNPDEHGWDLAIIGASYGNTEVTQVLRSESESESVEGHLSGPVPNEPHGRKPSKWSNKNKHDSVKLDKKDTVACFASSDDPHKEAAVVANHPVSAGLTSFYFEVEIVDDGAGDSADVGVGFSSDLAYLDSIPGSRSSKAPSWGYHGKSGKLFTRFDDGRRYKDTSGAKTVKPFGAGDVVGCGIDFTKGMDHAEIFYTLNGVELGVAFEKVSGRVFPAVGVRSMGLKIEVNFGKKSFEWQGEKKE